MKTFLASLLVAASLASLTNAQSKMAAGAGLVVSLPIGSFGDAANVGVWRNSSFRIKLCPANSRCWTNWLYILWY